MPNVCEFGFANLFGSSCNSTGWLSFHFLAIFWPTFFLLFFSQYIYYNITCFTAFDSHVFSILLWSGACIFLHAKKFYTIYKTRGGGYLGSHIDEERSKLRYVMRIATARESLNF